MVFLSYGTGGTLAEAAVRATVLAIIAWLIAYLSARLAEREELYRGVFDNSEAGILIVAKTGEGAVIQEANWNAARLIGSGNMPLQGALLSTCLGGDLAADLFVQLKKGRIYGEEISLVRPDGETVHAIVSSVLLPGNRAALSLVDITERVIAEEALQAANRKLSRLSQITSDHLRATASELIEDIESLSGRCVDTAIRPRLEDMRERARTLVRHIQLSETYQNLGALPPEWIRHWNSSSKTTGREYRGKRKRRFSSTTRGSTRALACSSAAR